MTARVIVIVDADQSIQSLVPRVEEMIESGLVVTFECDHEQNYPRRTQRVQHERLDPN